MLVIATTVSAVVVAILVNVATADWNPLVVGALVLAVVGSAAIEVRRHQQQRAAADDPVPDLDLDAACDRLAGAVRELWRGESEPRRLHDPRMLRVSWSVAHGDRVDHWSSIRGLANHVPDAAPVDLRGTPNRIIEPYRRLPHGRLVVLGEAGSGKTVLIQRFVLDLLESRRGNAPVPVIFSVGGWDPVRISLRGWLIEQLHRDQPGLARPVRDGGTLAAELVARDRVLPVLDGFDEIGHGLHREALRR